MNYCLQLAALKKIGLRRGIWFRVLNHLERAQVNLTLKIVAKVRSSLLARVLKAIIDKLSAALENTVSALTKSVGAVAAKRLSEIAQRWGHTSAECWTQDSGFARYLAIMHLNSTNNCRSSPEH